MKELNRYMRSTLKNMGTVRRLLEQAESICSDDVMDATRYIDDVELGIKSLKRTLASIQHKISESYHWQTHND